MLSPTEFGAFTKKIIKYLKYLYLRKKFRSFKIELNENIYSNWFYYNFSIEIIRNLKRGLCLKINPNLNYEFYQMMKESIHNLEEIKSVDIHSFKGPKEVRSITDYINLFDWTKVKCLNCADCMNGQLVFTNQLSYIPKEASFKKLYFDESKSICFKKSYNYLQNYANQIEHLNFYNFSDMNYFDRSHEFKLDSDYFDCFTKIKNIILIQCKHLLLIN